MGAGHSSKMACVASSVLEVEPLTFDAVFDEHARYVGRTLRYLGVPESDLEDACQEVFVVVHRRFAGVEGSMRAWIRQICVHVASNARRSVRRRRESALESAPEQVGGATQENDVDRGRMRQRLIALLDGLTEEQRTVFVLYEIESLPMQEIAAIAGCPLQTAYSRLHGARAKLEQAMEGS